jgi:hypothetical protein
MNVKKTFSGVTAAQIQKKPQTMKNVTGASFLIHNKQSITHTFQKVLYPKH